MTNQTSRPHDLEQDEAHVFEDLERRAAPSTGRAAECPDPSRLLAARAGTMAAPESAGLLAHLASCAVCQVLVEALDDPDVAAPNADEAMRLDQRVANALATTASPPRVLPFRRRAWWAAGASLGAIAAALVIAVLPAARAPADLPAVVVPRASLTAWSRGTILRVERLDTSSMGMASLSWRGDAGDQRPASDFDVARDAFDRGDVATAERQLTIIVERTPSFADAWLLLGVSRLLRGDAVGAIAPLERARAELDGAAGEDAAWHLAVALRSAGRDDDVRTVLAPICAGATGRAGMACLALDEMRTP